MGKSNIKCNIWSVTEALTVECDYIGLWVHILKGQYKF